MIEQEHPRDRDGALYRLCALDHDAGIGPKMTPAEVRQYMNDHQIVAGCESAVNLAVAKQSDKPLADVGFALLAGEATADPPRPLSLPKQVAAAGGITKWNEQPTLAQQIKMLDAACTATTVAEALTEVRGIMSLGHNLWAYSYLRKLYAKNANVYYGTLAADPALLLPVSQPGPRAGLVLVLDLPVLDGGAHPPRVPARPRQVRGLSRCKIIKIFIFFLIYGSR